MKLSEIMDLAERIRPDTGKSEINITDFIGIINELDEMIYENIIKKHDTDISFEPHTSDEDEVLAPDRFADMYLHYYFAKVDRRRCESERYANDMVVFNSVYSEYENYINREYMPKQKNSIRW